MPIFVKCSSYAMRRCLLDFRCNVVVVKYLLCFCVVI